MSKLFGTDGIRGKAYSELSRELAYKVGYCLICALKERGAESTRVLIGMDTRESSQVLADQLERGITEAGGSSLTVGVCPTPAVAYLLIKHGCDAGVVISASHNPYEYNGIKIFGRDGFKLSDELEERIEALVEQNQSYEICSPVGTGAEMPEGVQEYIDYLYSSFGVDLSGLRVGLDCSNGAASATAEALFTRLGCQCYMSGNTPNGVNINEKCGSTHIDALQAFVVNNGLDVGIAFDGDADRCIAVDEQGREIDGDYVMAILSLKLKSEGKLNKSAVVGTVMNNLGFEIFCKENRIDLIRTKVGDRYVLEEMNRRGYSLGGEQSGHIIIRELSTTGDGQLTAVALLSCLKESGKSLSALADVMRKYPQYMINIEADRDAKDKFASDPAIKEILELASKQAEGAGRILVRASGTEPLIRVMTEGRDAAFAEGLCVDTAEKLRQALKA